MKKLLLALLLTGFMVSVAEAQTSDADVSVKQVSREYNDSPLITSEDDMYGVFTNSSALSGFQQLATDANQLARISLQGDENQARLNQSGTGNIGVINIMGNFNEATLNQDGNGLLSAINIEGSSNTLDMIQSGNDLQNMLMLQGSGLDYDVLQNAAGINLTQTGSGTSIPLSVKQTGRSVPIIISNN
jgi:hypothetical protein